MRRHAAYGLVSAFVRGLAAEAGRADDVKKYSDQVAQIDPASPWTQRAMTLRSSLPPAAAAPQAEVPATGGVQIKLPGK
jgi:hypothetical protein